MSRDSVVPTALIRQLQISLRDDLSLSLSLPSSDLSSDPSSTPAPPPFASIQDAVASLDPSLDALARCGRCRGGLLCGDVSSLCVYCGEGFKGGVGVPPEISFLGTNAYRLLLQSLGFDGSESVNLDPESAESNKGRDTSKAGMILSDLLDLKLAFSPITIYATGMKTETKSEPCTTTFDLNLSGIDIDAVFKETKKEMSQIDTKVNKNQIPSGNQTTVVSSFAKWEPDFRSQPVNPSTPVQISAPAPENLSNRNLKKEAPEIESQADDEFDEWQDFAGLRASQNMPDSIENAGSSIERREPLKECDSSFNSKDVHSSGLDQSVLSGPEEVTKTIPEDELPIENRESLHAGEEESDDWKAFASSGGGEQGLSESGVKPELGLTELVTGKNVESLNHEDDLFDDWKNFTGPGVAEGGDSVLEEKTAPISDDLYTVNRENEALHAETTQGDVDNTFDEWNDFAGSGLGQSRSSGLEENADASFWDPLHATEIEKPSTMETSNGVNVEISDDRENYIGSVVEHIGFLVAEEKSQPTTQDQSTADEIKPSARTESTHVELSDSFDDWNDFTDSSAVQARLAGNVEKAQIISGDPLPISTTEKPSPNIETPNAEGNDSFDNWSDFTRSSAQPFNNNGRSNVSVTDSFDDWNDFTSSSSVQGGLPDAEEKNDPAAGNSSEISNVWPIGSADTNKDGVSIDLWSASVNEERATSVSNNGNTDLSNGWLDFMTPSQVNETVSVEGVKINNMDIGSSGNWLDFAGLNGPINIKSENVNLEKKDPDDLFNDWNAFTGPSQSVKPNSNIVEKNSKVGDPKPGHLSEDWLDIGASGGLGANPELKTENNGVNDGKGITNSDDWSNFTGMDDVRRTESSDDWQDFTVTGSVAAPVPSNAQDIDFGDFIQSSSSLAPTDRTNIDSLNGLPSDPLSFFLTPSNNILDPNSNSSVNSKTENASDIQKFLSQMSDLSFMLKDELSIPDKLHSK